MKELELQLRGLKSDTTFDLVCKVSSLLITLTRELFSHIVCSKTLSALQVLHVHESNGEWTFYVWDGTDTPAAEFQAM
jgi:hypothetical protein